MDHDIHGGPVWSQHPRWPCVGHDIHVGPVWVTIATVAQCRPRDPRWPRGERKSSLSGEGGDEGREEREPRRSVVTGLGLLIIYKRLPQRFVHFCRDLKLNKTRRTLEPRFQVQTENSESATADRGASCCI